jgi:hypothetical protein
VDDLIVDDDEDEDDGDDEEADISEEGVSGYLEGSDDRHGSYDD